MSGSKFLSQSKVVTSNPISPGASPLHPSPKIGPMPFNFFIVDGWYAWDSSEKKNVFLVYFAWNYWPPTRGLMWGPAEMTPVWKTLLS